MGSLTACSCINRQINAPPCENQVASPAVKVYFALLLNGARIAFIKENPTTD